MHTVDPTIESLMGASEFSRAIAEAIFPKIRGKVLALFMLNPEKRFYFREAVRIIGDSPASIQRELKSLTVAGILRMEPIGIQKFYSVNGECPVFEELRSIVKKTFGIPDALREVLKPHVGKIQLAWINGPDNSYGDSSGSEIDLTIIGTLWVGDLAAILEPVEKSLGRSIVPNLYTKEDFAKKCEREPGFRHSVSESKKIFLIGHPNELDNLVGK
jgi:hypothetical protein